MHNFIQYTVVPLYRHTLLPYVNTYVYVFQITRGLEQLENNTGYLKYSPLTLIWQGSADKGFHRKIKTQLEQLQSFIQFKYNAFLPLKSSNSLKYVLLSPNEEEIATGLLKLRQLLQLAVKLRFS